MLDTTYRELEKGIGYRFRKKERLLTAITHSSFRHESGGKAEDNQRLEFLGDAVLGLAVAAHLYETLPGLNEGEMTKLRSRLTSTRALAVVAAGVGLGRHLRLGRGESASGGHLRDSILADALEAVIGAAWLDGDMRAVSKIFNTLFIPTLSDSLAAISHDNPKGSLQEWTQQRSQSNPAYRTVSQNGPAHATIFTVEVYVGELRAGRGEGTSKQAAEIAAASDALQHLDQIAADIASTERKLT